MFLFGLLLSGVVSAQEVETETPAPMLISEELATVEEVPVAPVPTLFEDAPNPMLREKMHEDSGDCFFSKMGKHGDRDGKKMTKFHYGGAMIFFKVLHGVGMLIFLFLGAFVIRRGWNLGAGSCGKKKK